MFQTLGLRPGLKLDGEALRETFYELSRRTHPDKFILAPSPEPSYALRWSTAINRAYQTLRDPITRSQYLLESEKFPTPASTPVPLDLAEAYFDLQDLLTESPGEAQSENRLAVFRESLTRQLEETEKEWAPLAEAWESASNHGETLGKLHQHLTKLRYLRSMITDLDRKGSGNGNSRD